MFERFTQDARQVVVGAQEQARILHHPQVGTEHLLLAMLARPATIGGRALAGHGVTLAGATRAVLAATPGPGHELDAEALRAVGIDLDAVRTSVEASFGKGALDPATDPASAGARAGWSGRVPFSARAKRALEFSLREAIRLAHKRIADGHLLLGLLREERGTSALVLAGAGVDADRLRADVEAALRAAA